MGSVANYSLGTMEKSVYERRRYHSSSVQPVEILEHSGTPYNFVTFLATVTKFEVPLLQITWHRNRELLGRGGTSQIYEARTSLETSFAFKRIPDIQKQDKPESDIYQQLITEISILRHPAIREHPNVVELQGVCWDISRIKNLNRANDALPTISDGFSVWPVLVFDKAQFGDLYSFLASTSGRNLDIYQRLEMCIVIGRTIANMQSHRIIHGDIKPQNILMFSGSNRFNPKVADFGFSISHLHPETRLSLPCSTPWVAPEHSDTPDFDFKGALKADVFSFGMLCLWLLFEKQLSGVLPLSGSFRSQTVPSASGNDAALNVLSELKRRKCLNDLSVALVNGEVGLNAESKKALMKFFERCLSFDPELRDVDIQHSLEILDKQQPDTQPPIDMENTNTPIDFDTKLSRLLHVFYVCDYRVREHIFTELEASNSCYPNSVTETHIALCRKLAFGCRENNEQQVTPISAEIASEVELQLNGIKSSTSWVNGNIGDAYYRAVSEGLHEPMANTMKYGEDNVLQTAEEVTRHEIKTVEKFLGADNRCSLYLKGSLVALLHYQGRWQEAEELHVQVIKGLESEFGSHNPATLAGRSLLCAIYQKLGRWKDAEQLESKVMEELGSQLHDTHAQILDCVLGLSKTKTELGKWEEAEQVQLGIVNGYIRIFGEDHETTLNAMDKLVETYQEQRKWEEAEQLGLEIIKASERRFGPDHPSTLMAMRTLAMTYQLQGRTTLAEQRFLEVERACRQALGPEDPTTLHLMSNLANIYEELDRGEEATEIYFRVFEESQRILGVESPDTLSRMKNLVVALVERGERQLAETMALELLERLRKTFGHHHTSTLETMSVLSSLYLHQDRFAESEKLQSEVVERDKERLGPTHADTLRNISIIALIFLHQGRFKDAQNLQEEVFGALKSSAGENHPTTFFVMHELAETYAVRGHLTDASELMFQCKRGRTEVLGADHSDTKSSAEIAASILHSEYEMLEYLDAIGHFFIAPDILATTDILLKAAESPTLGVLADLLRRGRGQVKLTSEIIEAVARNESAYPIMLQLLDEYGDEVEITENVIDALSSNEECGLRLMNMLLLKRPDDMEITMKLRERVAEL